LAVILATREAEVGESWSAAGPRQKVSDPIRKITNGKTPGAMAQAMEYLPSNYKARFQNLQYQQNKKNFKKTKLERVL
jgi:hypothetical protein